MAGMVRAALRRKSLSSHKNRPLDYPARSLLIAAVNWDRVAGGWCERRAGTSGRGCRGLEGASAITNGTHGHATVRGSWLALAPAGLTRSLFSFLPELTRGLRSALPFHLSGQENGLPEGSLRGVTFRTRSRTSTKAHQAKAPHRGGAVPVRPQRALTSCCKHDKAPLSLRIIASPGRTGWFPQVVVQSWCRPQGIPGTIPATGTVNRDRVAGGWSWAACWDLR